MIKTIFHGKEKAWASSVAMFLVSLLMVRTNGDPLDPNAVTAVTNTGVEFATALVTAGIAWFTTWVTGNSTPEETEVVTPTETKEV